MVKIIVRPYPRKQFERAYGKRIRAVMGKRKEYEIHLLKRLKGKLRRETIDHELGHILSEKMKITRRLPISEKRRMLRSEFMEGLKRKDSGKRKIQEAIAEFYGWGFRRAGGGEKGRRLLKKTYPKSFRIIRKAARSFKPQLKFVKRFWK